jgi:hypothetical protein
VKKLSTEKKQKARPVAGSRQRPAATAVMARPRFSGGNHTRLVAFGGAEKYEWQADEAAARVLRGEENVARALTPVPAASFAVPASRGEPLPQELRRELEQGFGADLSAVRVHRDAAAAAAARAEDANAFVSGRDIYFSAGSFAPSREAGRELIAHEVAHVLQQTGRVSADGALRATTFKGTGEIQLQPLPGVSPPHRDELLNYLARVHTGAASSEGGERDRVSRFIRAICQRLGNQIEWGQASPAGRALANDVRAGTIQCQGQRQSLRGLPRAARSFLFDCLKFMWLFEGAAWLLDQDPELKTVWVVTEFMEHLQQHSSYGYEWIARILPTHPVLRPFWTNHFLQSIWAYLIDPDRGIQALYGGFDQTIRDRDVASDDWRILGDNDRVYLALQMLRAQDRARIQQLRRFEREVRGIPRGERKQQIALRVRNWGRNTQAEEGQWPVIREMGRRLEETGQRAFSFWADVLLAFEQSAALVQSIVHATGLGRARRAALLRELPEDASLRVLHSTLVRHASQLFRPGSNGAPLSIDSYAASCNQFLRALREQRRQLGTALRRVFRLSGTPDTDRALAIALAWVLLGVHEIEAALGEYSAREDRRRSQAHSAADYRIGHRIRVARVLLRLALLTGWLDLESSANSVVTAAQERRSVVALIGNWQEQPDVPFARMHRECAAMPATARIPLTVNHIAMFFQARYLERLGDTIEAILSREETDLTPGRRPILDRAREQAASMPRPTRWHVADFEFALNPRDDTPPHQLVFEHRKTQTQLLSQVQQLGTVVYPLDRTDEVFMWVIPPLGGLITMLMDVPELNDIVREQGVDVSRINRENPDHLAFWFQALSRVPRSLDQIRDLIAVQVSGDILAQRRRLHGLLRRVATHTRRVIAPRLAEELQSYARGSIEDYAKPNQVLTTIRRFAESVQPPEDELPQVAALVLDLAPALRAAFVREHWFGVTFERRHDLVTGYFDHLIAARDQMATTQNRDRLREVLHAGESFEHFLSNQEHITEVVRAFQTVRAQIQQRFGFKSEPGEGGLVLKSLVYSHEIRPGSPPFEIDGHTYRVKSIHRAFTYHPAYGSGTGAELQPVLKDANGRVIVERTGLPLVTIQIDDGEDQIVTDRSRRHLDLLSHVVEMRVFVIGLENLEEVLEEGADALLTALEFVPGYGQVVTVGRIVAGLAQFLAEDLPAIRDDLLQNPHEIVNQLVSAIQDSLTPERLWQFLLLGGGNPLADVRRRPRRRQRRRRRTRGRLGRLINAAGRVGDRFVEALGTLRRRMQGPLLSAQSSIASRPRLAFALSEVPNVLAGLAGISAAERGGIFAGLRDDPAAFGEALSSLLEGLQEMELPREVIPMDLVVETVVVFFLDRFGARGRLVRRILDATGQLPRVSGPIAEALRNTRADPNGIWRDEVLPSLQRRFERARDELVDALYELIGNALAGTDIQITRPTRDQLPAVEMRATDFPEAELFPSTTLQLQPDVVAAVDSHGGTPLPLGLRESIEGRFGHDFGHVRLHTGPDAGQLTEQLGVDGLTTGSHIFLRPGLSPATGHGQEILDHELSHVLQQTGPRPLGDWHHAYPTFGRPGVGIRLDPAREAAADRMAAAARSWEGPPIALAAGGGEGLLPSVSSIAARVLQALASPEFGPRFRRHIERAIVTEQVPGQQQANHIWQNVEARLSAVRDRDFKPFIRGEKEHVRDQILNRQGNRTAIRNAIRVLAQEAQRPRAGGHSGGQAQTELDPGRFVNLLQEYVFTRTGIAIHINRQEGTPSQIERLSVHYVHLGWIDASAPLWQRVMANTSGLGTTAEERETNRRQIHRRLEILGPLPDIWYVNRHGFRFSRRFLNAFRRQRQRESGVMPLPTWDVYSDPNRTSGIGLRVGTHGRLQGTATDRQSHHTTQYLLVQYFRNQSSPRLFGPGTRRLPGFEPEGGSEPERFVSDAGTIDLDALDPTGGRGDAMPAILIATETHQQESGRIHISQERSMQNPDGRRSQARTVDNTFQASLPRPLRKNASDADFTGYTSRSPRRAKRAIYNAMQGTYRWMYLGLMQPGLRVALRRREVAYYTGLAAREHTIAESGRIEDAYNPSASSVSRHRIEGVIRAAERNNDEVMRRGGWRAS